MSQVKSAPYQITHYKDGEPHAHSFTDRSEFIDKINIIKQAGVEYDAEWPDDEPAPFEADASQSDDHDKEANEPEAAPGERRAMQCDEHGESTHELYHSGEWLCIECEESEDTDESEITEEPEVMTNGGSENGINHPTQVVEDTNGVADERELPDTDPLSELGEELDTDPLDILPGHMKDTIKGTPAVNKRGYAMIAERYDIAVSATIESYPWENDEQRCVARATAVTDDGREYSGIATAAADDGDMPDQIIELAETRALKRATSWASGVGIVSYQELTNELEDKQ